MTVHPLQRRSADAQARLDAALTDLIQHRISFNQGWGLTVQALVLELVLCF